MRSKIIYVLLVCTLPIEATAQSLAEQWRDGLVGAQLTAYSGSVISSNSSLTVVNFCTGNRYSYYTEASWSVPGSAGGSSNNRITGRWGIRQQGRQVFLDYVTDSGEQGTFAIYLQNDGRVNIGGVAYSAQSGAATC